MEFILLENPTHLHPEAQTHVSEFFLETLPEHLQNAPRWQDSPMIEMTYFNISHCKCLLLDLLHGGGILAYSILNPEPNVLPDS